MLVTLRGQRVERIGVKSRTHLVNFDSTIVIINFKLRSDLSSNDQDQLHITLMLFCK